MNTAEAADWRHLTLKTDTDGFAVCFFLFLNLPFHILISVNFWFFSCPIQLSVHIFYDYIKDISQSLLSTFHSMRNDLFMNCVTFQE